MAKRFVTQLQNNAKAWRAGEIDYITFHECERDMWKAIQAAGSAVETAVVRALRNAHPPAAAHPPRADNRQIAHRITPRSESRRYRGELSRTAAGSPVLKLAAAHRHGGHADYRQMAAFLYELAADMERRSQLLGVHWAISPDAGNDRVVIELSGDHEAELADEFVANIMLHHQLT